jgi:hypothetical protein
MTGCPGAQQLSRAGREVKAVQPCIAEGTSHWQICRDWVYDQDLAGSRKHMHGWPGAALSRPAAGDDISVVVDRQPLDATFAGTEGMQYLAQAYCAVRADLIGAQGAWARTMVEVAVGNIQCVFIR